MMIDYLGECSGCGYFVYLSGKEIMDTTTGAEQQRLLNDLFRAYDGDTSPIYCAMCCDSEKGHFHRGTAMDRVARRWKLNDNRHDNINDNGSIKHDDDKRPRQTRKRSETCQHT